MQLACRWGVIAILDLCNLQFFVIMLPEIVKLNVVRTADGIRAGLSSPCRAWANELPPCFTTRVPHPYIRTLLPQAPDWHRRILNVGSYAHDFSSLVLAPLAHSDGGTRCTESIST